MDLNLKIIGALLIILALFHSFFPKYFGWRQELNSLSMVNRQIFYVHTFFVAFVVFLMGFLCITSSHELLHTPLGKRICLGLALFWVARLAIQFFGFSQQLWKGKGFETVIHIFFSIFWIYLSVVFVLGSLY